MKTFVCGHDPKYTKYSNIHWLTESNAFDPNYRFPSEKQIFNFAKCFMTFCQVCVEKTVLSLPERKLNKSHNEKMANGEISTNKIVFLGIFLIYYDNFFCRSV